MLTLFGIGAVVMRGAGCTINDLWDKNLDKRVLHMNNEANVGRTNGNETSCSGRLDTIPSAGISRNTIIPRTRGSNAIESVLYFPWSSKSESCRNLSSIQTHHVLAAIRVRYSLAGAMVTVGLAFNWGALLGWPALLGGDMMAWNVVLPLYASGIFWTLAYDTIYAHQVSLRAIDLIPG